MEKNKEVLQRRVPTFLQQGDKLGLLVIIAHSDPCALLMLMRMSGEILVVVEEAVSALSAFQPIVMDMFGNVPCDCVKVVGSVRAVCDRAREY